MEVKEQEKPNGIHGHTSIDRLGLAKLRSRRIRGLMNLIGRRQMKNHMGFYPTEATESLLRRDMLTRDEIAKLKTLKANWNVIRSVEVIADFTITFDAIRRLEADQ